jgi:thiol:disulfide interchange protein DsbD
MGLAPVEGQKPAGRAKITEPRHATFKAFVGPADPFSELNAVKLPPGKKVEFRRGETLWLTIAGSVTEGWHTYPLTRRTPDQVVEQLPSLEVKGEYLTPIYPILESEAEFKDRGPGVGVLLEHERPFFWSQEVYIKPEAPAGKTLELTVKIKAQVCKGKCIWEDHELKVPVSISEEMPAPLTTELAKQLEIKPAITVVSLPDKYKVKAEPEAPPGKTEEKKADQKGPSSPTVRTNPEKGLLASLLAAIGGGLFALLTPCVFPMLPITVSYFLKQSETKQNRAISLAAVYSGTIVVVMTAGGLALVSALATISQHYATNVFLGALFLFFALSLLGMYDITLPSWLTNFTAAREGQGGLIGAMFMALTFSIISFACVGPIYGGFGAVKASTSAVPNWLQLFLSVFTFSVVFASPFFVLALFPSLLRSIPQAGSWMNSVKVVMGFLELAAVFKFLRAAELDFYRKSEILTFDLCLGAYIALALACGLYLLNVYRLPHDHEAPETIGVPRLLFSLTFLALGVYLLPGMFKSEGGEPQKPSGNVFEWVESFLLPEPRPASPPATTSAPGKTGATGQAPTLVWLTDLDAAIRQAAREKKLIFIDFTALG